MTVTFHPRGTLGLGEPVPARLQLRTAEQAGAHKVGQTYHHVGDGGNLYRPDPTERLRAIYDYHVNHLGYGDIAYHGGFDADANVYGLRDGKYVGAHAGSTGNVANTLTDGIVFLEDSRGITPAALAAFEWCTNVYRLALGRRPEVFAHQWWAKGHGGLPTACPGDDWDRVVRFVGGHW